MDPKSPRNRLVRTALFAGFCFSVIFAVLQSRSRAAESVLQAPGKSLVALNMKFNGSASCNASGCHGDANPSAVAGARHGDEATVWKAHDKHATAYSTLTDNTLSATICQKMGIPDASKSEQCLSCHSLTVPAALVAENFDVKEGVSCNACHGPSEKWLAPHKTAGWIDAQRTALPDHQKLLETHGIFDTKPILARAERCTSCHLAIDAKMVAAGHPQPVFEMAYFSEAEPKHWREEDGAFVTKIWATGQACCLKEALLQIADRVATKTNTKSAVDQMHGHYVMFKQVVAIVAPDSVKKIDDEVTAQITAPDDKAAAAAADVAVIADAVSKHDFTVAETSTILKAVLASDEPTKIGPSAQLQQAEGIYELFTSENPASAGAADQASSDAAAAMVPDVPSGPLVDFDKKLKDAQTKIKLK